MNLQRVTGRPFTTVCIRCSARLTAGDGHDVAADLDGIPFRAYYCAPCARQRSRERDAAERAGEIIAGPIVEVRESDCPRTLCLYRPGVRLPASPCHFAFKGRVPNTGALACIGCGRIK